MYADKSYLMDVEPPKILLHPKFGILKIHCLGLHADMAYAGWSKK